MRYHHTSWSDVDRSLEAFKYARRSLLVVMAVALPFAAWDAVSAPDMTAQEDSEIWTVWQDVASDTPVFVGTVLQDEECTVDAAAKRTIDAAV